MQAAQTVRVMKWMDEQGRRLDFKGAMQSTSAPIHISTSSTATEAATT